MIAHLRGCLARLRAAEGGVVAIEFALLLPVLLLCYAIIFETGRAWLAQRKFNTAVESAARLAARHPEFERRVREGLPVIFARIVAPLDTSKVNLSLFSSKITGGAPTLVFPAYNFYGDASAMPWRDTVSGGLFEEGEAVIVVSGSYTYQPLFAGFLSGDIVFTRSYALNPFFSRSYNYQAENSDWNYFNVR